MQRDADAMSRRGATSFPARMAQAAELLKTRALAASRAGDWGSLHYPAPLSLWLMRRFLERASLGGNSMDARQETVGLTVGVLRAYPTYAEFAAASDPEIEALIRDGMGPAFEFLFAQARRAEHCRWGALEYSAPLSLDVMRGYVIAACCDGIDVACEQASVDRLAAAARAASFAAFAAEHPALVATPALRRWFARMFVALGRLRGAGAGDPTPRTSKNAVENEAPPTPHATT